MLKLAPSPAKAFVVRRRRADCKARCWDKYIEKNINIECPECPGNHIKINFSSMFATGLPVVQPAAPSKYSIYFMDLLHT